MDITLVNISTKTTFDGRSVNRLSTVGIYSLIACLEGLGIKVDFREYLLDFDKTPSQEIEDGLKFIENSSRIIGIGCHSIHLPFVVRLSQEIKRRFPEKLVILGSVGPSVVAKPLMERIKEIDAIVVGEAELNLPRLVKCLLTGSVDLAGIEGVVFRKNGKVIVNQPTKRIDNLDCLPLPAYDRLDIERYTQPMIMSARGCPFACPFCSLGAYWGRKVAYRSAEMMLEELKSLQERGVKSAFLADPCFTLSKKRVLDFTKQIKNNNIEMEFKCYGRLDLVDEEMCKILAEANFKTIFYGLETGSDNVLRQIKNGFNVQTGLEVIKLSRKYFKTIEVSLMWGFPFETLDDFKKTLEVHHYLKNELGCRVQLTWLQPFANTYFFKEYKDTLFLPKQVSAMYDKKMAKEQVHYTLDKCKIDDYTISLRSIISFSHVYSLAAKLIDENPELFPDFYRYCTPNLNEKIELANKIVPS